MKRVKIFFVWLVLMCTLGACEKDFNVSQQPGLKKMVVNSMFNDAGNMVVYVTTSYATSGSNNIQAINTAHIDLYEDSVFKESLQYVPSDSLNTFGSYQSALVPQPGKKYGIVVSEPKYGIATANTYVPIQPLITGWQLLQYGNPATGSKAVIADMYFNDDAQAANYYRINIWLGGNKITVTDQGDTTYQPYYEARGPQMLTPVTDTVRDGLFLLFSDRGFNGLNKELKMQFDNLDTAAFSNLDVYVELHTVSKDHYLYQQTLQLYRSSSNSKSSEPVHVYNNINNGYGIFAGEDFQSVKFTVK